MLTIESNVVEVIFRYQNPMSMFSEDVAGECKCSSLKRYAFFVPEYLKGELQVGDAVIVFCATGFQLCEVAAINVMRSSDGLRPVVAKVDMSPYFEEKKRQHKITLLRDKLQKEKKRLESMVTYELLADKSPEFKELLDEFKSLGGTL